MKDNLTEKLTARKLAAIARIGGTLAVLNLPDSIRETIKNCDDYETRVKMLELVADQLGK